MNTLTLREGILRSLDGSNVTVMVPADICTMTMEDLVRIKDLGAYCVYTEDLHGPKEPNKQTEAYPDNDGGSYTMEHGKAEKVTGPEKQKKPMVDTGKIKALADAGWSVQKIAEEMRLSGPTIRKYLKEAAT